MAGSPTIVSDGAFSYYDSGPYGFIDQVEGMFQQAKRAALKRGE